MEVSQCTSPNKYNGRNGWKPDMIVCHITEGSYSGAISWLMNPQAQASAHFIVAKDGRITQLVALTDSAWCNGTSTTTGDNRYYGNSRLDIVKQRKTNANYYTISIEHEGFYSDGKGILTEAQLAATIELMAHIRSEIKSLYGVEIPLDKEHITGHSAITPITKPNCPGQAFPFDQIIAELKKREENNLKNTVSKPEVKQINIKINNIILPINGIILEDYTYAKLQDFKQAGWKIDYDATLKMPIINTK